MPSQALYEKPIPVMEPPSPPDPIPVTTTEKITAAAKLAALLAKEILGKEMQSDAVCHSCGFRSPREFFISLCHITNEFKMHGDRKEIGARQKMKRERVLLFFGCCDML